MKLQEALEVLKRGGKISRDGRIFQLDADGARGVHDVTNPENSERVEFPNDIYRDADDWEDATPIAIEPDAVDEVLSEHS